MNKKSILYISITFFLSWTLVFVFHLSGREWTVINSMMVSVPYMFTPLIATIIVKKLIYKEKKVFYWKKLFTINKWFVFAWLIMPVLAFATMGVGLLIPGIEFSASLEGYINMLRAVIPPDKISLVEQQIASLPLHPLWLTLIQGLIAGLTINAIAGFGEEFGWREFLFVETKSKGFWKSSLLIGFIWGIWHAPLILKGHNYPEHPVLGVLMMAVWCILLSPIFSYVRYKSDSAIAAAIMHGTLNATIGISFMTLVGGNDLTRGMTGLAGFIVLALVNVLLIPMIKKDQEKFLSA